jgi:hypothetical protein
MQILRTPEPYPSTILSLTPAEQFRHDTATVQAITITPSEVTFSGPDAQGQLHVHPLDTYAAIRAAQASPTAHEALVAELQAGPSLTPAPARSAVQRAARKGIHSVRP